MQRVALTVAVAFLIAACGLIRERLGDSPMAHMSYDLDPSVFTGPNGTCVPEEWVTGVIVPTEHGLAAIKTDGGVLRELTWGSHNPATVDWNHRYTIGGRPFTGPLTLWACGGADSVIPR
jgi:hypothetical protein